MHTYTHRYYGVVLKWGHLQIIHLGRIFYEINHPALGVLPVYKTPWDSTHPSGVPNRCLRFALKLGPPLASLATSACRPDATCGRDSVGALGDWVGRQQNDVIFGDSMLTLWWFYGELYWLIWIFLKISQVMFWCLYWILYWSKLISYMDSSTRVLICCM